MPGAATNIWPARPWPDSRHCAGTQMQRSLIPPTALAQQTGMVPWEQRHSSLATAGLDLDTHVPGARTSIWPGMGPGMPAPIMGEASMPLFMPLPMRPGGGMGGPWGALNPPRGVPASMASPSKPCTAKGAIDEVLMPQCRRPGQDASTLHTGAQGGMSALPCPHTDKGVTRLQGVVGQPACLAAEGTHACCPASP